jgi:hypothetical protein
MWVDNVYVRTCINGNRHLFKIINILRILKYYAAKGLGLNKPTYG